ncbi:MAG: class I SAM-dependent methyltransferase [Nitrospirota bacterium]
MPDEKIQNNFTGRSGHLALSQAFAFYRLLNDILARNSKNIGNCTAVLDFGCGWGRIIRFFLKDMEASGLWGVDCLRDMIDISLTQNLKSNFKLIDPMPPTDFDADSFDVIYLYSVFSHLSEEAHLAWLREFARILKEGGIVVATTRPRAFIEYCGELAKLAKLEPWQEGAAKSFADPSKTLAEYDNGNFVHCPNGGGEGVLSPFFGETCIPKQYAEKAWSAIFSKIGFISTEEHKSFDQNVIFAIK